MAKMAKGGESNVVWQKGVALMAAYIENQQRHIMAEKRAGE